VGRRPIDLDFWGGGRAAHITNSGQRIIISTRHNYMHDVTRASLNKIRQNLLTKHFLAYLRVCDTIEG
jgi:hypothetical protein